MRDDKKQNKKPTRKFTMRFRGVPGGRGIREHCPGRRVLRAVRIINNNTTITHRARLADTPADLYKQKCRLKSETDDQTRVYDTRARI